MKRGNAENVLGFTTASAPVDQRMGMPMKALIAVALMLGIAITNAPSAAADESSYLRRVEVRYPYLSRQQLLAEGYKVCQFVSGSRSSSLAIPMVINDLGVSVPAAADIIATAVVELGC